MHFDDHYRSEVLEPARHAGDQPPEDLRVRYQLTEPLRPAEVAAQVKLVRQCWRRARGQLKYRRLIDRLEAEHRELIPLFTAAERGDPGPLRDRLRGGAERTARRHADARARLLDAAGPLRLLSPGDREAIARSSGLAGADLDDVLAADRIEVRDPDRLPATPPYQGYPKAREALDVLGHRHLADFLFGARAAGPLRVLDGVHTPGVRLDAAAVAAVAAEWARRPRDTTATNADTVLVALKSSPLDELIRYDLVDRLRERHRQRASAGALLRFAVEGLGIEPGDARRLVFAVQRESGPAGGLAGRLRELLDTGAVHAAALLTGSADLEDADVEVLVAEARERVATATRLREEAVACPDPDQAWRLLADALRLVGDLPGAEEHQRRLPPHPVAALDAVVDSVPVAAGRRLVVRLSWPETPSTAGAIGYRVLRQWDRPPRDAADGEVVASTGTTACDEDPPVNVPLFYAVVALRGDTAAPPVVTGPVRVRPEPAGVELVAGDGVVIGRWRCPPAAARVLVTRGDGVVVPADRTGFRDTVGNGTTHHYRVAAVYLDELGREVTTPGVRRSATPSAPPDPVAEFTVEPDPGEPGRLLCAFAPPHRGTAEIVLLPGPPPWPYGATVPVAEVYRAGRRVPAAPTPDGLSVRPGAGGVLLAVTVAGDTAAIGAHRRHVDLPPPRELVAQRRGGTVHVGFDWPEQVAEVEVTYQIGTRDPRRVVVTRAGYDAEGGLRLAVPEGEPVDVLVAASGVNDGTRVVGAPVAATVTERLLVDYHLDRAGPPWHRTVVITLGAEQPVRIPRLVLVLRDGRVMPRRPEDGETIASWTDVAVPARLSIPEPKRTGPFWLRCFTGDDVIELSDPPVRHLQVKR
jgi:hypothetical protein